MDKIELRKLYKKQRRCYSKNNIDLLSLKIFGQLKTNFNLKNKFIHTFISIESLNEVNTGFINDYIFELDSKLATSITKFSLNELSHSIIHKDSIYKIDQYNIPIPMEVISFELKELDIVLIPLLAFDNNGNRLGYGKGLYDSFLKDCKPDCLKIGLSIFEPHQSLIPSEPHDIKLDYCITPNEVHEFK